MKEKTTTIQIDIPSPPETHYLLPQEWKGKVELQGCDLAYDCDRGWRDTNTGVRWLGSAVLAVARLRPFNPQGLSDDIFRKLPMNARALSDAELERFRELGELEEPDEKLLYWLSIKADWQGKNRGRYTKTHAYATLHPANYYLELPDTAFVEGEKELNAPRPPKGYELITDQNDTCRKGDLVWIKGWVEAVGFIGESIDYCIERNAYVARPKVKPVWNHEKLSQNLLDKMPQPPEGFVRACW